jgi:hypothetical protein
MTTILDPHQPARYALFMSTTRCMTTSYYYVYATGNRAVSPRRTRM